MESLKRHFLKTSLKFTYFICKLHSKHICEYYDCQNYAAQLEFLEYFSGQISVTNDRM